MTYIYIVVKQRKIVVSNLIYLKQNFQTPGCWILLVEYHHNHVGERGARLDTGYSQGHLEREGLFIDVGLTRDVITSSASFAKC